MSRCRVASTSLPSPRPTQRHRRHRHADGHRHRIHVLSRGRRDRKFLRPRRVGGEPERYRGSRHGHVPQGGWHADSHLLPVPRLSRRTLRAEDVPQLRNPTGTLAVSAIVDSPAAAAAHGRADDVLGRRILRRPYERGGRRRCTAWFFAEGAQGFFDTFLLLANANLVPARVTVSFLTESGPPVACKSSSTGARGGRSLRAFMRNWPRSFSIAVQSDLPIISERAMYFPGAGRADASGRRPFEGGHSTAGVPCRVEAGSTPKARPATSSTPICWSAIRLPIRPQ